MRLGAARRALAAAMGQHLVAPLLLAIDGARFAGLPSVELLPAVRELGRLDATTSLEKLMNTNLMEAKPLAEEQLWTDAEGAKADEAVLTGLTLALRRGKDFDCEDSLLTVAAAHLASLQRRPRLLERLRTAATTC